MDSLCSTSCSCFLWEIEQTSCSVSHQEMIPFAVVGSDQEYQVNGKRILGRKTKWGTIEGETTALNADQSSSHRCCQKCWNEVRWCFCLAARHMFTSSMFVWLCNHGDKEGMCTDSLELLFISLEWERKAQANYVYVEQSYCMKEHSWGNMWHVFCRSNKRRGTSGS